MRTPRSGGSHGSACAGSDSTTACCDGRPALAYDYRLGGYDACFAALAMDLSGVWLTLDRAAHHRVAALGISRIPT